MRGESYSDFGENLVRQARRCATTSPSSFALRASVQNGFKAPSLQQQYFATTSTNFIGGVPFDITTFPVSDPVAIALGAKPLDAEESLNYSIGAVLRLGDLDDHGRRVSHRHRRSHRAVGEPHVGGCARIT